MRILAAAGLAGALLATTPLYAADLFGSAPPPMDAPVDQELGSNWYIRGDVGYGQIKQDTVTLDSGLFPTVGMQPIGDAATPMSAARGNAQTTETPVFNLGFGYRINDWFRAEADWQYSKGPGWSGKYLAYCPEVATAVPTGSTLTVGYQYDYTTCDGNIKINQYNNTALVMGYVDLGHWGLFTPYLGLGAGVNANTVSGTLVYNQTDTGAIYQGAQVNGTAPAIWVTGAPGGGYEVLPTGPNPRGNPQGIGPANWNRTISSTKFTFAGAAAAGLGIKISQSATLDLAYKIETLDLSGGVKGMMQNVNLGVRYNIN